MINKNPELIIIPKYEKIVPQMLLNLFLNFDKMASV